MWMMRPAENPTLALIVTLTLVCACEAKEKMSGLGSQASHQLSDLEQLLVAAQLLLVPCCWHSLLADPQTPLSP